MLLFFSISCQCEAPPSCLCEATGIGGGEGLVKIIYSYYQLWYNVEYL